VASTTTHPPGDDVHTTQLNLETLRHRSAAPPRPGTEHLIDVRTAHPPSRRREAREVIAAGLARAARRLDRDAARRAIA
jgi:hypothetical protein